MLQTPAERCLVAILTELIRHCPATAEPTRLLDVGAGASLSIEDQLAARGSGFVADRVDIEPHLIDPSRPFAGESFVAPVERMTPVPSGAYDAAFSNYLLEHVADVQAAAAEIRRVLRPGGLFVTTVPNPLAPQFVLARLTPTAFHRWVRGAHAFETHYAYGSIGGLVRIFEAAGFATREVGRFSFVEGYLWRTPSLRALGRSYDRAVSALRLGGLTGDACLTFMNR